MAGFRQILDTEPDFRSIPSVFTITALELFWLWLYSPAFLFCPLCREKSYSEYLKTCSTVWKRMRRASWKWPWSIHTSSRSPGTLLLHHGGALSLHVKIEESNKFVTIFCHSPHGEMPDNLCNPWYENLIAFPDFHEDWYAISFYDSEPRGSLTSSDFDLLGHLLTKEVKINLKTNKWLIRNCR